MSPIVWMALPVQQWQADAAGGVVETPQVETPEGGGEGGGLAEHLSADDIFSQTFKELSSDDPIAIEDPNAPQVEETPQGEVEGALPTAEQVAEAARQKAAGKQPTGQQQQPTGQQPTGQEPAKPADKPIEQVLRDLLGEREAKPAPVVEQPKPEPYKVPEYTEDQKKIVEAYQAEFPEMAKAEEIIRSREYSAVTNYIFSQVRPVLEAQAAEIKQLTERLTSVSGHQQMQHVEQSVGGSIAEMQPKIEAWIETQPDFIKPAYKEIAARGTAAQVIGLVKAYQAANPAQQQPKPKPTPPAQQEQGKVITQPVVVPQAKPKVPAGLRPVPSVRSTPQDTQVARDDFDGAFSAFASQGTGTR